MSRKSSSPKPTSRRRLRMRSALVAVAAEATPPLLPGPASPTTLLDDPPGPDVLDGLEGLDGPIGPDILESRSSLLGNDGRKYWVENHLDKTVQTQAAGDSTRKEYLLVWAGDVNV